MNMTFQEAEELIGTIVDDMEEYGKPEGVEVVVCPPFPYLELATDIASDGPISVGAQNINEHEKGAYTGEVSASMLISMEVDYCIIGHSERRKYFEETDELVADKLNLLLKNNITPIVCIGEQLDERKSEKHKEVVRSQMEKGVFHLSQSAFSKVVIAYEPVWAIGTGETATPEQAQEMHSFIRDLVREKYNEKTAGNLTILYGGSCNAGNARDLFAQQDVDGGLIGGASLKAGEFIAITRSF